MFIGRTKELSYIDSLLKTDKFEGLLIYRIRRIGKSEIIKQFFY